MDETEQAPFFHGTTARLEVGDLLTAGRPSKYRALRDGAGLAAAD